MTVRSLKNYKQNKLSKVLLSDISNMLTSVDYSIKLFEGWRHYKPAKEIYNQLLLSKGTLELFKIKYEKMAKESEEK